MFCCTSKARVQQGLQRAAKFLSTSASCRQETKGCQLLVVGGGAGGISTAAKFSSKLGRGKVCVLEPRDVHCYQPLWTLVGGGLKDVADSARPMNRVMPANAEWIKDSAEGFQPRDNIVVTKGGLRIKYDFLVVAVGIQVRFDMIKGLQEALETPHVGSNYSYHTVTRTYGALQNFKEGNAIFTYPTTPAKCPGAAQKIMYLTDAYLRKTGKRSKAKIMFNTSLGVLFGVPKYADSLWRVVKDRDIMVNLKHELIEVRPQSREAIFRLLDSTATPKETVTYKYEMLHVVPPMVAPAVLKTGESLADAAGFLDVDGKTLQHKTYPNIFGIGDCTNVPTAKTAAAVAGEVGVLHHNLGSVMQGKSVEKKYDGYTSCPLITGYNKCILAEFDFQLEPLETFPMDQGVERRSMYHLKKDLMPQMYWNVFLRGHWEGPGLMRKALHFGFSK